MAQPSDVSATELPIMEPSAAEEAPSRRRWRTRWIVLGSLAALVLLLAAVLGPVGWRLLNPEKATLTTPDSVAGLTLDNSSDARQTTDYLRTAVAARTSLSSTVGAAYDDPANADRKVLLFGGTGVDLSPSRVLDQAFGLLNDESGSVTEVRDMPAGPLGGVVRCGTSNGDGGAMSVCGWADNASLAVALFPGRTIDAAAKLMLELRTAVEHQR
jgi:hypothetical protein